MSAPGNPPDSSGEKSQVLSMEAAEARPKRKSRRVPVVYGKQQTISQRAVQARKILEMRWSGAHWKEIARETGLTRRACTEVFNRETRLGDPQWLYLDQVKILEKVVQGFQRDVRVFEAIAEDAIGQNNLAVAVGAMKGKAACLDRIVALLQNIEHLPKHLGAVKHVIDFQALALSMVKMMEAVERGDQTTQEAADFFRKQTKIGHPPVLEIVSND